MKGEGFATAFERLDREIACLRRQVACSSLWAWNWESRIYRGEDLPPVIIQASAPRPISSRRTGWELAVAAIVACFALCACRPEDGPTEPERSDPFEPHAPITVRAAHRLGDGSIVLLMERSN